MLYKKVFVTSEDVRRINNDLINKKLETQLSDSDEIFFNYIKKVVGNRYNKKGVSNVQRVECNVRANV